MAHEQDMDIVEFMRGFYHVQYPGPIYLGLIVGVIVSFVLTFRNHAKKLNVLVIFLFLFNL